MIIPKTRIDSSEGLKVEDSGVISLHLIITGTDHNRPDLEKHHRATFLPGFPLEANLEAINRHFDQLNYPHISTEDINAIKGVAQAAWTPAVVAAFKQSMED